MEILKNFGLTVQKVNFCLSCKEELKHVITEGFETR